MKRITFTVLFAASLSLFSQEARPIRDNVGFCWQRSQMQNLLGYLQKVDTKKWELRDMVAGISPHDDYLYAGRIYYPLFRSIRTRQALIFGVTHSAVRREINDPQNVIILDDYVSWRGLEADVPVSLLRQYITSHLPAADYLVSDKAHSLEHSIEALVPFLQYFNPDIQITPVMVAPMPLERMQALSEKLAGVIAEYIQGNSLQLGRDIFFLVSTDANHYGPDFSNSPFGLDEEAHEKGTAQDLRIANTYLSGEIDAAKVEGLTRELWGATYRDSRDIYWCGKYDIPFGMLTISKIVEKVLGKKLRGEILRYSDTYSEGVIPLKNPGFGITAPFSFKHWVGFFSATYSPVPAVR